MAAADLACFVAVGVGSVVAVFVGGWMLGFWLAAQIASGIVDGKRGQ